MVKITQSVRFWVSVPLLLFFVIQGALFAGYFQDSLVIQRLPDLTILLAASILVILRLNQSTHGLDRFFWSLLLGSIFCRTANLIFHFMGHTLFSPPSVLLGFGYFLFYTLMLASIETQGYRRASDLLTFQSLLNWIGVVVFSMGAFLFLMLIPSLFPTLGTSMQTQVSHYLLLMDLYLAVRWLKLANISDSRTCQGYRWFSLAFALLFVADYVNFAVETHIKAQWLWFLPGVAMLCALTRPLSDVQNSDTLSLKARHSMLNHPITFIGIFLALLLLHHILVLDNESSRNAQLIAISVLLGILLVLCALNIVWQKQSQLQTSLVNQQLNRDIQFHEEQLSEHIEKYEQQSASFQTILESTNNAIFTVDSNGVILSANQAAQRMLGYLPEQLIGEPFTKVLHEGEELSLLFQYKSYRQQLDTSPMGLEKETMAITQDGEPLNVHATISRVHDLQQQEYVISLTDISEQKKAELESHKLKDKFIANITHEFRTPLTIINGVIDKILMKPLPNVDKEQLHTAKRNSLRLIKMVEQLLELSKVQDSDLVLNDFDAKQLVLFVCQSFKEISKGSNIDFQFDVEHSIFVRGNPQALEKILFNLLSNAFKYTPEGGNVELRVTEHSRHYEVQVKDTGIGIPESEKIRIFDRFHRVSNHAATGIQGVGIGLALVKELINLLRWDVKLESEQGKGTVVTITIPQSEIQSNETLEHDFEKSAYANLAIQTEKAESKQPMAKTSSNKQSLLVIEDNPDMQSHLKSILSEKHHCLFASTGEEGLSLAINYVPDIIVSDVMLPGMDGFEVLRTLREMEMTNHIPIIMLTAKSDTNSKIEGLESAADDYVTKPFDARELLLRIQNLLNSRKKLQEKLSAQWQGASMPKAVKPKLETRDDRFLFKLKEKVAEHYENSDLTMNVLASELAMSERQLQRKVKALLGFSPLDYLKRYRLEIAREQLLENKQIGLVAQACGFSSQTYFGRCFKEQYGISPSEYQKQHSYT